MSSNNRDHTIDILKGVSIGAIMLLHYEQGIFPDWLNVWIGSFMISAFYFTSGWIPGKKPEPTFRGLLQKRWKSIGLPYLWFSGLLIIVSIMFLIFGHYDSRIVLRDIYKTFTNYIMSVVPGCHLLSFVCSHAFWRFPSSRSIFTGNGTPSSL